MTVTATEAPTPLNMGWVVGSTFRVVTRRWLDLLLMGVPLIWLPNLLTGFAPQSIGSGGPSLNLVAGLPGLVFIGAANLITYAELAGGAPVALGDALRRAGGKFGSLFGVSFVTNLATIVGLVLLIAPGVIAIVGWMAAPAAVMIENKPMAAALTRSWELSRGSRWRLVGLLLAVLAISLVLIVLGGVLTYAAGQAGDTPLVDFGVTPIWVLLISTVTAVGQGAAYTGLRIAKEGGAGDVSAVFA